MLVASISEAGLWYLHNVIHVFRAYMPCPRFAAGAPGSASLSKRRVGRLTLLNAASFDCLHILFSNGVYLRIEICSWRINYICPSPLSTAWVRGCSPVLESLPCVDFRKYLERLACQVGSHTSSHENRYKVRIPVWCKKKNRKRTKKIKKKKKKRGGDQCVSYLQQYT